MSFWSSFVLAVALSLLGDAEGYAAPVPGRGDEASDPLPDGAIARLGTARWRPGKDIQFLACSPDGRLVASGVADGTVGLWDTATGRLVRTFWGHRQYVFAGCFSPDSKLLVSGGHDSIGQGEHGQEAIVWDAATGKALHRFSMPGNVVAAGFADKGKVVIAVSWQGTVCRWRVEGGKEIGRFRIDGWLNHPSLSPAGDLLAVEVRSRGLGTDQRSLWNTTTGEEIHKLPDNGAMTFSPDGKRLALFGKEQITLWDVTTNKKVRDLAHKGYADRLAFSPDGKTFAIEGVGTGDIHLRDIETGRTLGTLRGHQHNIRSLAFTPDGKRLLSGTAEMTIRVWDVERGTQVLAGTGPDGYLGSLAFAPNGRTLLAGAFDRGIRLWETATGRELQRFEAGSREVTLASAFSPDGKLAAAGGGSGIIQVWDIERRRRLFELKPGNVIYSLAFAPDGRTLYSAGFEPEIRRWDLLKGEALPSLKGHEGYLRTLNLSQDGKLLVSSGSDGTIRLWDTAAGKARAVLKGHETLIYGTSLSADGKLLASKGRDGTIRLWDVAAAKEIRRWPSPFVWTLALSPDGKHLATASGQVVRLYETETGKELPALVGHRGGVEYVTFSADGALLASGGQDTSVLVWDARRLLDWKRPQRVVLAAAEWDARWEQLAEKEENADALAILSAAGEATVERLRGRIPELLEERKRLDRLLAALKDDRFAVRERAMGELRQLKSSAEPALRDALERARDADLRARLQTLLRDLPPGQLAAPATRSARIVRLLERIGSPAAHGLLRELAPDDRAPPPK